MRNALMLALLTSVLTGCVTRTTYHPSTASERKVESRRTTWIWQKEFWE